MQRMIEVKTAELDGAALDWAVASTLGWQVEIKPISTYSNASTGHRQKATGYRLWMVSDVEPEECTPSTDWSQGGHLLESYRTAFLIVAEGEEFVAVLPDHGAAGVGATHLIAACRAIVAAKLGETVSVPAELLA